MEKEVKGQKRARDNNSREGVKRENPPICIPYGLQKEGIGTSSAAMLQTTAPSPSPHHSYSIGSSRHESKPRRGFKENRAERKRD